MAVYTSLSEIRNPFEKRTSRCIRYLKRVVKQSRRYCMYLSHVAPMIKYFHIQISLETLTRLYATKTTLFLIDHTNARFMTRNNQPASSQPPWEPGFSTSTADSPSVCEKLSTSSDRELRSPSEANDKVSWSSDGSP